MRIYSMTATFGKLEHETLTLEPGLNVLHKPNEWGKSTWCAFLIAMLYGLDTRAKSTRRSLADKERSAPWSGAPMAGRIDLNWNGRDITIERSTKGRIPLGQFRAYETASGLAVPELDGMNCGQRLLGVERSVFARAGFIRFSDLPVTQDEALRRRLNALVTTGDESGDADTLGSALRELKNRCRYNRSGLLPQARQQLEALLRKLDELTALEEQAKKLRVRQGEVSAWQNSLSNHAQALRYAGAEADAAKVAEAREEFDRAVKRMEALERACASLPSREETRQMLLKTKQFVESWSAAQLEESLPPPPPAPAEAPPPFRELNPDGAEAKAREDADRYARLAKPTWLAFLLAAMAAILTGGVLLALGKTLFGISAGVPGLGLLLFALSQKRRRAKERAAIAGRYPTADPGQWLPLAEDYREDTRDAAAALARYRASRAELDLRLENLNRQREALCGAQTPEKALESWNQAAACWDSFDTARRETLRLEKHWKTLRSMASQAVRPASPDTLEYTPEETQALLLDAQAEEKRLQSRLGQLEGRMEALGDRGALEREIGAVKARIGKLEEYWQALTLAQETLAEAAAELQRRFAPQITRRAQEYLQTLTQGRYSRLTLGEDFSLGTEAEREDTLRPVSWRSDGTVDQLYLALRLAVAEALTPGAPVVLDDALIRFDEERLRAAMELLKALANDQQVIVFSCRAQEALCIMDS